MTKKSPIKAQKSTNSASVDHKLIMKVVILLAVLTVAYGFVVVPESKVKYADKDFLLKQKLILELFQHIQQNDIHTEVYTMAKSYDIESHYDSYTNVEAVKEFVSLWKHGLLPREEIFTPYHEEYMNEAIALFHVLYYAKDWDTFYKTLIWARYHVNPGMFIYATTGKYTSTPIFEHSQAIYPFHYSCCDPSS